jgi:hypothetical protein
MVDFSDDHRPIIFSSCLYSIVSDKYDTFTLVFPDDSRSANTTGFDVPLNIFAAEISTLHDALIFIKSNRSNDYLMLSYSLRFVYCGFLLMDSQKRG